MIGEGRCWRSAEGAALVRGRAGPTDAFSGEGVGRVAVSFFFFQAEDGIRDVAVTGVQTCALPIFQLGLSYLRGRRDPDSGSAPARDLVEGWVLFGVGPVEWLTLSAGPHARAYAANGQTQRWVYWELRMRAAKPFIGTAVRGYAELWRAVAADANVPEPFDHAQGGEAGMIVRFARAPFEARVAYRIDHAVLGGGSRLETVDGVVIGVGLSRR